MVLIGSILLVLILLIIRQDVAVVIQHTQGQFRQPLMVRIQFTFAGAQEVAVNIPELRISIFLEPVPVQQRLLLP